MLIVKEREREGGKKRYINRYILDLFWNDVDGESDIVNTTYMRTHKSISCFRKDFSFTIVEVPGVKFHSIFVEQNYYWFW